MVSSRDGGQFCLFPTVQNPFLHERFLLWFENVGHESCILEPFAGSGALASFLPDSNWALFDISPGHENVIQRDTIANFPKKFDTCITNPPFKRLRGDMRICMNESGGTSNLENLYEIAISLALRNCRYVAMILPQSFIFRGERYKRLEAVVGFRLKMTSARQPVLLALFGPSETENFEVWLEDLFLGSFRELNGLLPEVGGCLSVRRCREGKVGLVASDAWRGLKSHFVEGRDVPDRPLDDACRSSARFAISGLEHLDDDAWRCVIDRANETLTEFRKQTGDLLLSSLFEHGADGAIRRRVAFCLARRVLSLVAREFITW